MALSKEQLKQFRELLIQERAKFAGEIRSIAQDASKNPRDASGDLSAYTIHMADMSSDTYERELAMNIASTEQQVLYQIDDALKRIDEGTYGACVTCNKPITLSRLKAVPYAAQCIECQREQERKPKSKPSA
jgi:RNA polymerase-binding protein DksA